MQRQAGGLRLVELPRETVLLSVNGGQVDNPHGLSLYRSLPFVARVCRIIENATAQVWQRMGAPSFHVNWEPGSPADPKGRLSGEVLADLQQQWGLTMAAREAGEEHDFFTSGNVSVKVVGAEGTALSIQEPFRAFVEQMVAVTGLPPWMLGLHWSATERLSLQQADLIVANVEAIRRTAQPELERLIELRQRLRGRSGRFRVKWSAVNLRDLTEQARGEAWQEQARQRRLENGLRMWQLGYWTQEQAARDADPALVTVARRLETPPEGPRRLNVGLSPSGEG